MSEQYCKLYIQNDLSLEETELQLENSLRATGLDKHIEFIVNQNEDFNGDQLSAEDYDFVMKSNVYVDVYSHENIEVPYNTYIADVAQTVEITRSMRWIVVASCEFEDFIQSKTGWNWTEKNQIQPS